MYANRLALELNKRFPFAPGYQAFAANHNRVSFVDPMTDHGNPHYFDVLPYRGGFLVKWTEDNGGNELEFIDFNKLCEYVDERIAYSHR